MPVYKDKERGTWYVKCSYKDWDGKRKQKLKRGFTKRKDAVEFEREFLTRSEGADLTVKQLCDLFLEDRKDRVKPTTYDSYESGIRLKIVPYLGEIPINELSALQVRKWHEKMRNSGKTAHGLLTAVLHFGQRYYGLERNVAYDEGTPKTDSEPQKVRVWSMEQYFLFKEYVNKYEYTVLFDTLFYSGMRVGEMMALKWNDVDWEQKTLRVDENRVQTNKGAVMVTPKTRFSYRTIIMPDFYMKELREFYNRCYDNTQETRVFSFVSNRNTVYTYLLRRIEESGLPRITLHDFRHSHASLLIDMGMPITLVSSRLGHSSPAITLKVYAHLIPSTESKLAEKLENEYHLRITASENKKKSLDT